jgi:hypothetical protein
MPLAARVNQARFINDRFVAVSGNGLILFSPDGLSWESRSAPTTETLNAVAHGKGRYVAGGYFVLAYSLDGVTWTVQPAPFQVYDIQFIDGWFVAVGNISGKLVSRDGVRWTSVDDLALNEYALTTLTYGGGVMVAGGGISLYRGTLHDSEAFKERLRFLVPAQLEYYGRTGFEYRLEQSTDLKGWYPDSPWAEGADQYLLWDVGPLQAPARFWRVVGRSP